MRTVLVVDDDAYVRSMLRATLTAASYDVLEAANGREAVRIYERNSISAVILDIIMPDSDGLETIRNLRRNDPAAKIIAISGGGLIEPESYLDAARNLGAACTFVKPLDNQDLLAVLGEVTGAVGVEGP